MGKLTYRLLLVANLAAGVAHADDKLTEAKQHLERGVALYNESNFGGALAEFQRAHELAPSYRILFNIAQVEMELEDHAAAFRAYTRYLKEGGPDIAPARRAQVTAQIERLRGRVGFLVIQTAPGAQVFVDEAQVGYAPLSEPVAVKAGRHRVTVNVPGREPVTRVFDVVVTAVVAVDLPVAPPVEPPPPTQLAQPGAAGPDRTAMYVAWPITGGLVIGAAVFAAITRHDGNDLAALRSRYPVTSEQLASQHARTVRDAAVTDALAGAAVVSAGIALYLTYRVSPSRERAVQIQIAPSGAAIAGRF
jgi:tetratricopeptide (TPR) repeat protein